MESKSPAFVKFTQILETAVHKQASDIHLKAGLIPVMRKHGILRPVAKEFAPISAQEMQDVANDLLTEEQMKTLLTKKELDVGFGLPRSGRFRINIFQQRGSLRLVARNIPMKIPALDELNLPEMLAKIANNERGLVLITGITGSGKSSTLAAMIDYINTNKNTHILTIEDPIEYLIRDRKSIITQRELGQDAISYSAALRAALRQDPDVILIGEMRDRETIDIALQAAETGHLVFSTLHTMDANETINRILSAYEPHQQKQVRMQLGAVLKAVVSQRLARLKDGSGYIPAVEILINNARIREMIEDPAKTKEIHLAIEEGRVAWGMQSFDQHLMDLVHSGEIEYEEAIALSTRPDDFAVRFSGVTGGESGSRWGTNTALRKRENDAWDGISELEIDRPVSNSSTDDDEDVA